MPSELINLNALFTNKIFRIPDYQRGYSWEQKQWEELWNDLKNIHNGSFHFTGIITLEKVCYESINMWLNEFDNEEETDIENNSLLININNKIYGAYFIVDGQQRLITLMVIISILRNFLVPSEQIQNKFISIRQLENVKYIFGYAKDIPSYQHLIRDIFEDETMIVDEPETIYTNNLKKAKVHFKTKIEVLDQNQKERLYKKLTDKLLFNVFEIPSILNTSMVFETLNYRGKQLSKLELFKNRLIFLVTIRHPTIANNIRTQIINTWQDIYEWLGKSPELKLNDDDYLRAFWIMYYTHDNGTDEHFNKYEEDIFDHKYKISEISQNEFLNPHCLERLLIYLSKSIKFWYFIHYPKTTEVFFSSFNLRIRILLEKISRNNKGDFLKPLMLAYFLREVNHAEIEHLLIQVERHNYCVYLLAGRQADTNRPQLSRIINQYFRLSYNHNAVIGLIKEKINELVNFEFIQNHIHNNRAKNQKFYDWNGIKYTLWEYEEHLQEENERFLNDYVKSNKDLICPNENIAWLNKNYSLVTRSRDPESIEKLVYSLGNITLTRNSKKPNSFSNLRNNLQNGSYSDREIFNSYEDWTDKNILARGIKILTFIENHWQINIGNDDEKRRLLISQIRI